MEIAGGKVKIIGPVVSLLLFYFANLQIVLFWDIFLF